MPVTNLYRDEILDVGAVPMAFVAYSKCFRREAGSAGKDTRGILRTHEFDKVELVRYATPGDVGRTARAAHAPRGDDARAPRAALSSQAARRGRHRLQLGDDLRPRGLGAGRRRVARGVVVQLLHRLPGATREHSLSSGEGREAALRSHAERIGARLSAHDRVHPRALSERRTDP